MKVLFHIFGIPISFFGVMIALGILSGIFVAYIEVKRKKLDVEKLFDIALYTIISAIVGARVFYILFYNLSYYLNNPVEIIKINEGGLSIHGGLIGAFIFAFFYFRKYKLSFLKYADAIAPGIILGQGIGRIGCDVFGKVMAVPRPWSIEWHGQLLHPTQLYEFVLNYLVFFILWRKRKHIRYDGQLFIWYIILFAFNRSIVEFFRDNPLIGGWFSISYLLSALLITIAILLMLYAKKKKANDTDECNEDTPVNKWDLVKDILITIVLIVVSAVIYFTVYS